MNNAYNAYKNTTVETADQGKLILIAYDVAIKHCRLSLEIFENGGDASERNKHLFKAQDAITELMSALRMDVGEIAHNLFRLYEYMGWNLVQAVIKNDPTGVHEALKHLLSLRDAWEYAARVTRTGVAGEDQATSRTFAAKV